MAKKEKERTKANTPMKVDIIPKNHITKQGSWLILDGQGKRGLVITMKINKQIDTQQNGGGTNFIQQQSCYTGHIQRYTLYSSLCV